MVSFCLKKRMYIVLLGGVSAFCLLLHMVSAAYSSTTIMAGQPGGQPLAIQAQGNDGATPTVSPRASGNEMGVVVSPQSTTLPAGSASLLALPTMPALPTLGSDLSSAIPTPTSSSGNNPLSTAPTQVAAPSKSGPAQPASSSPKKSDPAQPAIPVQGSNPLPGGLLPSIGLLPAIPAQSGVQQNNQGFQGITHSGNSALLIGHNEGNSGNPGLNRGFNQDDSVDGGNQVAGQRKAIGVQANNQLITGHGGSGSNSGNSSTNIGFDQGNSGNSGINLGNNQDNAGNFGNQVNNQANVIGTQVNKQGTTVNNDNNVIQHQINYVNLLPNVGVYLGVRPKLEFSVSVGK